MNQVCGPSPALPCPHQIPATFFGGLDADDCCQPPAAIP